jgi:hypothetical protein
MLSDKPWLIDEEQRLRQLVRKEKASVTFHKLWAKVVPQLKIRYIIWVYL